MVLREHRLTDKDRPDFFAPSEGIAVELKTQGSRASVLRQLNRYATHPDVKVLCLVTSKANLTKMPASLKGKPLYVTFTGWRALCTG